MSWYEYLPSSISIYLVLVSHFSERYLDSLIDTVINSDTSLEKYRTFIKNIALDWADRVAFFNFLGVTMVSVFVVYGNTQSYPLAVITFVLLWLVSIPLLFWIISLPLGDLHGTKTRRLGKKPAFICNFIVVLMNIILLVAIFVSQQLSANPSTGLNTPTL